MDRKGAASSLSHDPSRLCLVLTLATFLAATPAHGEAQPVSAPLTEQNSEPNPALNLADAELWLLWHADVLDAMSLQIRLDGQPARRGDGTYIRLPSIDAAVRAAPGQFDEFEGDYRWPAIWELRHGRKALDLQNLQLEADDLRFALRDEANEVWFYLGAGHPQMAADHSRIHLTGAELRIGPALASWLQAPALEDQPLAMVIGRFPLSASALRPARAAQGCPIPPRWPGTLIDPQNPSLGSYQADVLLLTITPLRLLRCRQLAAPGQSCDGPGSSEGEVALAPDAQLRNSNAANSADVPWYGKFLGVFPPYGNDQHPYLVWNLYRQDPDGYLLQIGRSGLKHAFVTINNGCTLGCSPPPPANANNVLYPNCSDVYSVSTNDTLQFLGPRAELIPASGVWGRCGSIFDPDCDGNEDPPSTDPYALRLVARESAIDPAANPGASYFSDAWYVVRDDVDIDNTMGSRELQPSFAAGAWAFAFLDSGLHQGPMVQRWAFAPQNGGERSLSRIRTAEGEIALGVRVDQIGPSLWRYRYVLSNLDYARAATSGAVPNLRIDNERGISGFAIPLLSGSSSATGFRDGDPSPGNDWDVTSIPAELHWSAPDPSAELRWGNLLSFGFESSSAPGFAQATIELAGSPGASSIDMRTLLPGGELLADGFE